MAGRLAASVMHEINNPSQAIGDLVYLIAKDADHPELVRAHAAEVEQQLVRIQYIARQTLFFRDTPRTQMKDLVPTDGYGVALPRGPAGGEADSPTQRDAGHAAWFGVSWRLSSTGFEPGAQLRRSTTPRGNALRAAESFLARECAPGSGKATSRCILAGDREARLFEAFQSDKADAGNGLGLWICKTIVEKHGGQIRWRSSLKAATHGTTFSIVLPLAGPEGGQGYGERSPSYAAG